MSQAESKRAGRAWYSADRTSFLCADRDSVVAELSSAASAQGWHIEAQQHREWGAIIGILQDGFCPSATTETEALRDALEETGLTAYADVILEFDFRRRGLRIDCILLAPGIIAVLEFKRSKLTPADADQVINYCVNLVEFHEESRRLCEMGRSIVVPFLVQTEGRYDGRADGSEEFHAEPWGAVLRNPIRCDGAGLGQALAKALALRSGQVQPSFIAIGSTCRPQDTGLPRRPQVSRRPAGD